MKLSPSCGCCDPCNERVTLFTPTSKYTRGGYEEWIRNHVYEPGETFAHYRNAGGRVCEWLVTVPTVSGSGWTAFEESRYQLIEVIDYLDEVDEWHLYGSGWDGLTPAQLEWHLQGGRLADRMGFVSKGDILPDLKNFLATFDFQLGFNAAAGMKYQMFAAMTLNASNEPQDYFACDVELAASNVAHKLTLYRVVGQQSQEIYDTHPGPEPRTFCRRPEISGGQFQGGVNLESLPAPTLRNILPQVGDPLDWIGYSFVITKGTGNIPGDTGSLAVSEGDVIFLDDVSAPYEATSWIVYSPGSTVSLTDVLTCGLSTETPDTENTITGLKVGVYVVLGSAAGTATITDFVRVTTKLNGTITKPDCPICGLANQCPCESTSYPGLARLGQGPELGKYITMYPYGLSTAPGQIVGGMDPPTEIGLLGSTTNKINDCTYQFIRAKAFDQKRTIQLPGILQYGRSTTIVWEYTTLSIFRRNPFIVRMKTTSEIRGYSVGFVYQNGSYPPVETVSSILASYGGSLDDIWANQNLYFFRADLYTRMASGQAASMDVPLDLFDCEAFTLQGTYSVDHIAPRANLWIGDYWTVESA